MSRGFIRGVWGIYDKSGTLGRNYTRRTKIDNDIRLAMVNPYAPKCRVYVFGDDNFKRITDLGFDAVLVDNKPICWDMNKEQYRHKIEVWKFGLKDFDEVVFLDWDCVPCAPIPADFWDVLGKGEKVKATIFMYSLQRVPFRYPDARKVSSSTFVYMNEKNIANEIIEVWEQMGRPWQEEVALSKYIDLLNGGWKGIHDYKAKFEPPYHTLFSGYGADYVRDVMMQHNIFYHLNSLKVARILGDGTQKGVKVRLDGWQEREHRGVAGLYRSLIANEKK